MQTPTSLHAFLQVKRDEKKKLKSGPMAVNMSKVRSFE
jgi:hypothetical protein